MGKMLKYLLLYNTNTKDTKKISKSKSLTFYSRLLVDQVSERLGMRIYVIGLKFQTVAKTMLYRFLLDTRDFVPTGTSIWRYKHQSEKFDCFDFLIKTLLVTTHAYPAILVRNFWFELFQKHYGSACRYI